jgi:hypothetical protein
MLNKRTWWLTGAVALALLAAVTVIKRDSSVSSDDVTAEREITAPGVTERISPIDNTSASSTHSPMASNAIDQASQAVNDGEAFRVSDTGALVLDEQTRVNIERLVAHTDAANLDSEISEQVENLPPIAAQQVRELIERFVHYQQAQRQIQPPDRTPATVDDAIQELHQLHALREAHFGVEVARHFYGQEEAIAREMIELMRLENDQSLTPEEKLQRAQALREQLPGIAAIERKNRDAVDRTPQQKK